MCTTVVAHFNGLLSNEVVVHLWFNVDNSLWGEGIHQRLNRSGELSKDPFPKNKTWVFYFFLKRKINMKCTKWCKNTSRTCFHEQNWTQRLRSFQNVSWTRSAPSALLLCRFHLKLRDSFQSQWLCRTPAASAMPALQNMQPNQKVRH